MAYKVSYYTLKILRDNKIGKEKQYFSVFYTNENIKDIPSLLNYYLKPSHIGVITKIEEVEGICLSSKDIK